MLIKTNLFLLVLIILLGSNNANALVASQASTLSHQATSFKSIRKLTKRKRSLKERILTKILKRKIKRNLAKSKPQKEPISADKMSKLGIWAIGLSGLSLLLFAGLATGSLAYTFALILIILAVLLSFAAIVASIIALNRNELEAKDKKIIIRAVIGIILGVCGFLASAMFAFLMLLFPY